MRFATLLIALLLTACFPRLAPYSDAPVVEASPAPVPFQPGLGPVAIDKLKAFIMLQNPYLSSDLVQLEAELIIKHAEEKGVPTSLVAGLIATESSFNPRAVSPVGAQGLGQLMPPTARDMGVNDPFDVEQNIHGTTRYLAWLGKLWEAHPRRWEMVLASYLAGIGTVRGQIKAGKDLTREQEAYARKILTFSSKLS